MPEPAPELAESTVLTDVVFTSGRAAGAAAVLAGVLIVTGLAWLVALPSRGILPAGGGSWGLC